MAIVNESQTRELVWETIAQFWVDTEWDSDELSEFATKLAVLPLSLERLDHIVRREVCGGFAIFTLVIFFSGGMGLPDGEYPLDDARARVQRFVDRPFFAFLNPFWWLGFVVARWFIAKSWPDLRGRVCSIRKFAA